MSSLARSKPKWWSAFLALLVFCVSLVQPAFAATPAPSSDLINLLRQYNVVRGDSNGDLQLGAPITRAEFATVLVRITGHEAEVENLKGLGLFTDTKGHWADGYATAARINGLIKGFEDGSFRPQEPVTYAQALTLVLRLVGREPDPNNWPTSALMDAIDLKIVPPGFTGVPMLNQPAVRGEIFTSVGMALTTVKTADGSTYFQKYFDTTAPELAITSASTATTAAYQLKGTAKGASKVTVNGETATLSGDSFTKSVTLQAGQNRFTVEAVDLTGNKATKEFVVTRSSAAASLTITGPEQVAVGSSNTYDIVAYDANDNEVSAEGVQARVTGNIGTFDPATGTFRASQTPGTGKITVTLGSATASTDVEVLGTATGASSLGIKFTNVAYTKPMTVTVSVLGADGLLVANDFGRTVKLTATGTGVSVSPTEATTVNGVATFTVRGTAIGDVTLSASSSGLTGATEKAAFTTTTQVALVTQQTRIPTSGTQIATVYAELRNENGEPIQNKSGKDIYVNLTITGPGNLSNQQVRIGNNASNSAQSQSTALVSPSGAVGTIEVAGTLADTSLKYSVAKVSIQTYTATVGAGTKFRVIPITSRVVLDDGKPGDHAAEFMVQLVDVNGTPIVASDYAFQVQVSTSNNEAKVDGVPEGMTVQIGDNAGLNPVSNGKADGDDVIARTVGGYATIKVTYTKPGTVTIKPIAVSSTTEAYNSKGEAGDAVASQGSWIDDQSAGTAEFRVTANSIKLTADSDLFGKDAPAISHKAGSSKPYTLHAYATWYDKNSDEETPTRYWVPGVIRKVELWKTVKSVTSKVSSGEIREGKVDFTITASGTADDEAVYEVRDVSGATVPLEDSQLLYVNTVGAAPEAAGQPSLRGMPSHMSDAVMADDDEMEIDLPTDSEQSYVVVSVYVDGGSKIYTSGPVYVKDGLPTITVPKDKIPAGTKSFYLKYKNGYGEATEKGVLSYPLTNYTVASNVSIASAKYDATKQILIVTGSNFANTDMIYGEKLELQDLNVKDPNKDDTYVPGVANLSGAQPEYVSSTTLKLHLDSIDSTELDKIATFGGASVRLNAKVGWVSKSTGTMGGEDTGNVVKPMGYIDYAAYDRINHVVVIYGRGFQSGTIKKSLIKVGSHAIDETKMTVSTPRDTEIWVTLNAAAQDEVEGSNAITVSAEDGWLSDGLSTPVGKMAGYESIMLYGFVKPSRVSYTSAGDVIVEGSGFTGGDFGTGKVYVYDALRDVSIQLTPAKIEGGKLYYKIGADDLEEFTKNFKSAVFLVADEGWFEVPKSTAAGETETRISPALLQSAGIKFNK